jgi:hypothetical protein
MGTIYVLVDPRNGDIRYVGFTAGDLETRRRDHLSERKKNNNETHRARWLRKLKKLKLEPMIRVVQQIPLYCWQQAEQYWIAFFRQEGCPLTNATEGGEGTLGWRARPETRQRMSKAQKGHLLSEESRRKISKAKKGVKSKLTPEQRRANARKNYTWTPEQRIKFSAATKGQKRKPHTPEAKVKISASSKGRVKSEKECLNISLGKKGKPNLKLRGFKHTDETREKIRQVALARTAEQKQRAADGRKRAMQLRQGETTAPGAGESEKE